MNKLVIPLAAVLIGVVAAIAGFNSLKGFRTSTSLSGSLTVIGEVTEAKGEVQRRLPRSSQLEPIEPQTPFHAQEWLITGRDSSAVVVFLNANALRLGNDTRIIAEQDPNSSETLLVTVLSGDVSISSPGPADHLRVFRNGLEFKPPHGNLIPKVPLIRSGSTNSNSGSVPHADTASGTSSVSAPSATPVPLVTATTADESAIVTATPAATPPRVLPSFQKSRSAKKNEDTLTNEEIARQLKSQTSFFQRCYLSFINRIQTAEGEPQTTGPSGVISVGFTIQPNGKTTGVKIVKSELQDPTLQKCVSEVVERTSFRSFDSDAVLVTEFPISLK